MKEKKYEKIKENFEKDIYKINDMQYKTKIKLGKIYVLFRSRLFAGAIKKKQIQGIIALADKYGFKELLIADDDEGLIATIY